MLYTFYKGIKCGSTRMNAVKASKAQCWNYRFYVKPILSNFWRSKTALLTILVALNFDFWKMSKIPPKKYQNLELLNCSKWEFWVHYNNLIWFHIKSEWQENLEISTLCKAREAFFNAINSLFMWKWQKRHFLPF